MPTCPLCLAENPPAAAVCLRCGLFRFPAGSADSGRIEFPDPPSGDDRFAAVPESGHAEPDFDPDDDPRVRTVRGPVTIPAAEMPKPPPVPVGPTMKLVVTRGLKVGVEYPIYDGENGIGRTADAPADIDLTAQEPPDQVWASRRHAVIVLAGGTLMLEDLNSLNGTYLNKNRVHPGRRHYLSPNDVIAVGTVHLKVVSG